MMNSRTMLASFALFLLAATLPAQPRPHKKLIQFGWDVATPEFVRDHITQMEQRPFDGIIFRLPTNNHAFDTTPWTSAELQPQMRALAQIKWGKFTDNFLMLYAANLKGMAWDNDTQWTAIGENMKRFAQAVKAGRCAGICFDPEPYGTDPWQFAGQYGGKTYEQVSRQVRQRGREFIAALQGAQPSLKVLTFFQLSIGVEYLRQPDEKIRRKILEADHYALWLPFFLGMLEGAGPGVTFIDGNEPSYYYESSESYYRAYHLMRQKALELVPVDLREKYNAQSRAGAALYVDQVLALRENEKILSRSMTPPERLKLLEHNTYYALATTDEYVWCYGEKMNWWGTVSRTSPGGEVVVPGGLEAGLNAARGKIARGEPLGFDIRGMVEAAHARQKANSR